MHNLHSLLYFIRCFWFPKIEDLKDYNFLAVRVMSFSSQPLSMPHSPTNVQAPTPAKLI